MIKRTLYFGNPAYLSTRLEQLVVSFPEQEREHKTIPIEDVGLIVIDHQQITITSAVFSKLMQNKVAVVHCDEKHMPVSLHQPLVGHSEQTERFREQIFASKPLKKNLWKQVVEQKIVNQAKLLETTGEDVVPMYKYAASVLSGDTTNQESNAAAYYWRYLFDDDLEFKREREGEPPNHFLNYGYAILRAMTARAIISSGMLPNLGIHHRNKYNAYCLADDLMEPYRIYVDELVLELVNAGFLDDQLPKEIKTELLQIPAFDVQINGKSRPLMNALSITTASLYKCFTGERRSLDLPEYEPFTNIK